MLWTYRVIKRLDSDQHPMYGVHEVYDLIDGTAWTGMVCPDEESVESLRRTLKRMLRACDRPVMTVTGDVLVTLEPMAEKAEEELMVPEIGLGDLVQDVVTGYEGVVTGMCQILHGSPTCLVTVQKNVAGEIKQTWIEVGRLDVLRPAKDLGRYGGEAQ